MKHLCLIVLWVMVLGAVPDANSQTRVSDSVVAGGGTSMSGPGHFVAGTVGQAVIGLAAGSGHRHSAGFWLQLGSPLTGVAGEPLTPAAGSHLAGCYPNPFNPLTTIRFRTAETGRVTLRLYDLAGRSLRTLVDAVLTSGAHEVALDGSDLASGVYVCRLQAGSFAQSRKLALVK